MNYPFFFINKIIFVLNLLTAQKPSKKVDSLNLHERWTGWDLDIRQVEVRSAISTYPLFLIHIVGELNQIFICLNIMLIIQILE
jgi:hypothetical protein